MIDVRRRVAAQAERGQRERTLVRCYCAQWADACWDGVWSLVLRPGRKIDLNQETTIDGVAVRLPVTIALEDAPPHLTHLCPQLVGPGPGQRAAEFHKGAFRDLPRYGGKK